MRKALTWIGVTAAVLIAIAIALPFFLPAEIYKDQVAKRVEVATGRTLTIDGDLSLQFFPAFQIQVNQAALGNVPGSTNETMIRMDRLLVGVNPAALLRREIIITDFILEQPEINLEVARDGTPNWDFSSDDASGDAIDSSPPENSSSSMSIVALSDIKVSDGKVSYTNRQSGDSYVFDDVDMTISMANLSSPFSAKGSMIYNDEKVDVSVDIRSLSAFTQETTSPIGIEINSAPVDVSLDGSYTGGATSKLSGTTKLEIPSLEKFDAWSGSALGGNLVGALAVSGQLSAVGSIYEFTQATVRYDEMTGTGNLKIDGRKEKPKLSGRLDVRELDFRPYMKESETSQVSGSSGFPAWSSDKIEADVLRLFDADFELTASRLWFLNYEIGASNLTMSVRNGVLKSNLKRLDLYEGKGIGDLTVDASGRTPNLQLSLNLSAINSEPLVLAATQRDLLSGLGDFIVTMNTNGQTQKDWMGGLTGSGELFLNNGEIRGVDLTKMVSLVSTFTGVNLSQQNSDETLNQESGAARKTEFVEMGGTFRITNGVLSTNDLKLDNDLISLTGRGTIDIGRQTVDLRIDPGLNQEDGGTKISIKVSGPWNNLTYAPDFEQLLVDELKEQLGVKEDSPANLLLDAIFGSQAPPQNEPEKTE